MTLPFDDRPFRLRMGLRPLDPDDWLQPDELAVEQLGYKRRLVDERYDDVVAVVDRPEVHAACAELWSMVAAAAPGAADRSGEHEHPIVRCGVGTQEDWALLVEVDGRPVLAAACVCFPTKWVLAEKIGHPMGEVHRPVAFYAEQLEVPVDRHVDRLSADRPVWRQNWNLMDDPELFQPGPGHPSALQPGITAENAGERVWLRVERQTLRRLPRSGAVAFSIRVHQRAVADLADDELRILRTAVANLPAETAEYKGIPAFGDALDAWISRRVRTT